MAQEKAVLSHQTATAAIAGPMVVARFTDGRIVKGTTQDFMPHKQSFHIYEGDEAASATEVALGDLKAIFFVKSYDGCKERIDFYDFDETRGYGRKCVVEFHDGEMISGYTQGYSRDRAGFFLVPADDSGNNERVFVINKAVKSVNWA